MEFSDLNDEIGADDWLIPSEEISRRRLIKRTPRYNIYKADWFGDVLVYEPVGIARDNEQYNLKQQHQQQEDLYSTRRRLNQEELSSRLSELNLGGGIGLSKTSQIATSRLSLGSDCEQTDSAYSSISSTPKYHTKNIKSEFEFPTASSKLISSSWSSITSLTDDNDDNNINSIDDNQQRQEIQYSSEKKQVKQQQANSSPVILNKDSYTFNHQITMQQQHSKVNSGSSSQEEQQSSCSSYWLELNELRLVAHESFMLFMGASMDYNEETTLAQSTSLVMQMNHPKAMSLYNLLHATKFTTSPIDRFFASKQQRLTTGAKLNICQQVTNAMTYLHDKNIVHGKLTSVNIYIELNQRVKISMIDNSEQAIAACKTTARGSSHNINSVEFNLPSLTYLSPELIRTIKVADGAKSKCDIESVRIDTYQLSKESDIFSFGTFLYELFEERFPFSESQNLTSATKLFESPLLSSTPIGLSTLDSPNGESMLVKWNGNIKASANELIFQIGSGHIGHKNLNNNLNNTGCSALVEFIISACWSMEPTMRPQFKQLAFT